MTNEPIVNTGDIFEQRYELLELLGSGGLGVVYKARQLDSGRILALKILHANVAADEEFKIRFMREAQALSKLNHEHIVTVYHLGLTVTGVPYMAMELIEGRSLRRVLNQDGRLSPERSINIALQVCLALELVHAAGIVHRDLKPDNVILLDSPESDFVKLIDFGLAHVSASGSEQKLTGTGMLIGTVDYMSPEQCKGLPVDVRSDLYSLCVCIYEMITGKPPFVADNPVGLMYKHVNEAPAPLVHTGNTLEAGLNEFLLKGLAKDSSARFASAGDMGLALKSILSKTQNGGESRSAIKVSPGLAFGLAVGILTMALLCLSYQIKAHNLSHVQVLVRKPALPGARTALVSQEDMMNLFARSDLPASHRVQAVLEFVQTHEDDPSAIELCAKAYELAEKQLSRSRPGLTHRIMFALALLYCSTANSKMAIPLLQKVVSLEPELRQRWKKNDSNEDLVLKDIGTARGLLGLSYWHLGEKANAEYLAEIIAAEPYNGGDSEAMVICIESGNHELAKLIISNSHTAPSILDLTVLCRRYRNWTLVQYCLERAQKLTQDEYTPIYTKTEQGFFYYLTNQTDKARKLLSGVSNDKGLLYALGNLRQVNHVIELAGLLELLGLHKDAVAVANSNSNGVLQFNLLKAHLCARDKDYAKARTYLTDSMIIVDLETKKKRKAVERLDDLQNGKADSNLGLVDIHLLAHI